MKLFLLKFLFFAILLFVFAIIADYCISTTLKQSRQGEYGVWNDLFQGKINADLIIHGSSRAWVQLNTHIIEEKFNMQSYNLGSDAYGFHMTACRHKLLLELNKKPSTIIQVLDFSMFDKGKYLYNTEQFFPYVSNPTIKEFTSSYEGLSVLDVILPYYRYIGKYRPQYLAAKILLRPDLNKPDRYKGYQGQNFTWNDDFDNAIKNVQGPFNENIDSAIVQLFRNYLEDCKKRNIQLIFVYPPEYIDGQNFVHNRAEIFRLFNSLALLYKIPLLDYSNHPMVYQKQYFYNSEHLNTQGADIFTDDFCKDVIELRILSKKLSI
jgi:hypothetical protein